MGMKRKSKRTLICIFQLDAGIIETGEEEETGQDGVRTTGGRCACKPIKG